MIRLQRFALVLICLVLLLFFALKIVEVHRETVIKQQTMSVGTVLGHGLARRLDDPSFWAVLACAFSAIFVMRAEKAMVIQRLRHASCYLIWLGVSAICIITYVLTVYHNHETFFHPSRDPVIWTVQRIEACANVVVLLSAPLFFAAGLAALNLTGRVLEAGGKDESARQSAAALASAGTGPFISAAIALLAWQLIDFAGTKLKWWHVKPDVFGLADAAVDILALLLFLAPFLVLFGLVLWRLRRCFRFKFHKVDVLPPPLNVILVMVGLGAIVAGGYYEAEWRSLKGCLTPPAIPVIQSELLK